MSDSSTTAPAGVGSEVSMRAAIIQMAIGASLLSSTSLFVVYAHTAPTVSGFYRMLLGGGMLLIWVIARGTWQSFAWRDLAWALPGAWFFSGPHPMASQHSLGGAWRCDVAHQLSGVPDGCRGIGVLSRTPGSLVCARHAASDGGLVDAGRGALVGL